MAKEQRPLIFSIIDNQGHYVPARLHDYWWGVPLFIGTVTLIVIGIIVGGGLFLRGI